VLVPKDSPLRKVPMSVPPKNVLFADGVRYSLEIADVSYSRLLSSTERLSGLDRESSEMQPDIVCAVADAWLFVDSLHRLRELVQALPGLKQKDPEVQVFLRGTRHMEDLRHTVQHYRTGIHDFVDRRAPLGGLCRGAPRVQVF